MGLTSIFSSNPRIKRAREKQYFVGRLVERRASQMQPSCSSLGVNSLHPGHLTPVAEYIDASQAPVATFDVATDVECRGVRIINHGLERLHLGRQIVIVKLHSVPLVDPTALVVCLVYCHITPALMNHGNGGIVEIGHRQWLAIGAGEDEGFVLVSSGGRHPESSNGRYLPVPISNHRHLTRLVVGKCQRRRGLAPLIFHGNFVDRLALSVDEIVQNSIVPAAGVSICTVHHNEGAGRCRGTWSATAVGIFDASCHRHQHQIAGRIDATCSADPFAGHYQHEEQSGDSFIPGPFIPSC
mmetsp:Transcript_5889/g.16575  ORF Transcript_5889/g.16575 Transcript_5889/m.16575 type:complete len:298 (-) Transcript_5889:76-969(-)